MKRLIIPAIVLLAAAATWQDAQPIDKAAQYLWSHQAADGGWHSETYGLLKSGQSLTPFVLNTLLRMPNPPASQVDRAIRFLQAHTDAQGAVGRMDPLLFDYPNYATALTVQSICRARRPGWQHTIEPMMQYLRSQQFTEARGWKREQAPYGAWGMGGVELTPPNPGHVDISMTRHVLEAFAAAGAKADDPAFQRAAVYLDRCQNPDGGFYFSTVVLDANKAGESAKGPRSYSTATADGILASLAIGRGRDRDQVRAALAWLAGHHNETGAPGFTGDAFKRWPQGLRFYYAAASRAADPNLHSALIADQRPDGSWANPETLVKEDDPLIATTFAILSLLR